MRILVSERLMPIATESFFFLSHFSFVLLRMASDSGLSSADNARFVHAVEDDMRDFTNLPAMGREVSSVRSFLVILLC